MTKRLFWLALGITVGALVARKIVKAAESYTPQGLASSARGSAVGLVDSVKDFLDDVRAGMTERESEIHAALESGATLDAEHLSDPDFPAVDRGDDRYR